VVNEAFDLIPNSGGKFGLKPAAPFYPALKTYVEDAFKAAHAADPGAKLFYNDYMLVDKQTAKREAVADMIKDFKRRGIPIHGVGMQMHIKVDQGITEDMVDSSIKLFGSVGVKVHITELDVACPKCSSSNKEENQKQADVYRNVLKACLKNHGVCEALLTWGFTDAYTWLGSNNYPLPFDKDYGKKHAYRSMLKTLNAASIKGKTPLKLSPPVSAP